VGDFDGEDCKENGDGFNCKTEYGTDYITSHAGFASDSDSDGEGFKEDGDGFCAEEENGGGFEVSPVNRMKEAVVQSESVRSSEGQRATWKSLVKMFQEM
jgi:hypothetical protein